MTKKRGLVAHEDGGAVLRESLTPQGQLRANQIEALAQFAPLLAGAVMLSCFVLAAILYGRISPAHVVTWSLLVIASCWLMIRRIENTALVYARRDPPTQALIEAALLVGLVAGMWATIPVTVYPREPSDIQTVLVGAIYAMMCGALAIAAVPRAALIWAGILAGSLAVALHLDGDHFSLPLTALLLFHFGFTVAVISRNAAMLSRRAEEQAHAQSEIESTSLLMREYEERGTSCLWQTDAAHILSYATPGIGALLGRPVNQLVGASLPVLVGGSGALGSAMLRRADFNAIEVEFGEGRSRRSVVFSGTPIMDSASGFLGFRGSCTDVTEARTSERRLRQLASLDVLTELPNRMRMRELLGEALLSARSSGRPCGILLLDLDGFKPVNDTFGHPKGDAVLKTVAERLVARITDRGIVGRLGGDEFGIVLHDAQNRKAIAELAETLIAQISEPYVLDGVSVRIGVSIGSAFGPIDGDTVDELIKKSDMALYEAKAAGRGVYRQFECAMQNEAENRMRLEHDLRLALPLKQFRLHYQPLIDSHTQEVRGFEALIRWQHPVRGFVSPADFVPLAEEIGLIHEIGEWVASTAIKDCAQWPASISVAVNISPIQLLSPGLPAMISDALSRAKLPANRLELEVTESVFLRDSNGSLDVLRRLRALGVRIALDDFGTGYSSLGYLNRTIFNTLKIDGSFVRGASVRSETVSIIQAIVTLANCFQMTIIAEGVETQEDYRLMVELGCHQIQGYLFGRPVPFDRATEMVGTRWSEARRLASV
ncbi:putative bifunctional diguanylate cyclase/phosphodiesterase [Sphingomonas abietis]|uniref:EAL domain-containing protein n=1 Tax=Sphingomonas abietis TaxID=3012344 RepID=A0ABY7NNI9_9SPHN|nr:EAL domain-containing protein [Sphingomonas abietis]WBO21066.1 EAL domain-containing protein [Sphingomonas abietis]